MNDGRIIPERQIRALHDGSTITVYQAFPAEIADAAVRSGTLVAPFSFSRMTWIKPSFFWMMHRSNWATARSQERVLAIRIIRAGFDNAVNQACSSSFDPAQHSSLEAWQQTLAHAPSRIQWDPERDFRLNRLHYRTIQIGLGPGMSREYASQWIEQVDDVTELAHQVRHLVSIGQVDEAATVAPVETPYDHPLFPVTDA